MSPLLGITIPRYGAMRAAHNAELTPVGQSALRSEYSASQLTV